MNSLLVIDDDEIIREMLVVMLEDEGYTVTGAADGKKGFALVKAQQFDLVITDIVMPEQEGMETIMQITQEYPDMPIIAISGGGSIEPESYLNIAKQFGARYTFTKPFDNGEMLEAVKKCLGGTGD